MPAKSPLPRHDFPPDVRSIVVEFIDTFKHFRVVDPRQIWWIARHPNQSLRVLQALRVGNSYSQRRGAIAFSSRVASLVTETGLVPSRLRPVVSCTPE